MWKQALAGRIKQAREKQGYTQKGMAEALGLSVQSVCAWENGNALPSFKNLELLASLTNTPVEHFFVSPTMTANGVRLTPAEEQLVEMYRKLNEDGKKHADAVIKCLLLDPGMRFK